MTSQHTLGRRDFLKSTPLVVGGLGALAHATFADSPADKKTLTVQDVIDHVIDQHARIDRLETTIDTLKAGDPGQPVHGIVTTFMPTVAVIKQAIKLKANFIIPHEPTFYNHQDETDWLEDDPVYQYKRKLIRDHGLAVWRYHDHPHRRTPDTFITALAERLGWAGAVSPDDGRVFNIPTTRLADLAAHCKQTLDVQTLRYVGDPDLACQTIAVLPGAWGGHKQIGILSEGMIDALICGEVNEWETCEYVRDARHTNRPVGLIVTGHQVSEEDGMKHFADWLRTQYPNLPIHHLPASDPFTHI